MAVKYFILAGPQAAGKSTLGARIFADESAIVSLQESRQIVINKVGKKGAIFMTYADELEAIHHDMTRMFRILDENRTDRVYVDETNVFTLGHARAHGIDLVEGYFRQYSDLLKELNSGVIFIDVPPSVSWERRKHRYAQRLWDMNEQDRESTMGLYKGYLERLYPELLAIYERLDLPKFKIDGTLTPDAILSAAQQAMEGLQ